MNDICDTMSREKILELEKILSSHPDAMFGDCMPLKHDFADGIYVREIRVPKGHVVVTKIFKQDHATFLMQGKCSVATENGIKEISAPFHMMTKAGVKRVILIHEDVVWITVHGNPTNEKDIEKIEQFVIAKNYDELLSDDEKKLIEMATK
jgi:hypothetical protein